MYAILDMGKQENIYKRSCALLLNQFKDHKSTFLLFKSNLVISGDTILQEVSYIVETYELLYISNLSLFLSKSE